MEGKQYIFNFLRQYPWTCFSSRSSSNYQNGTDTYEWARAIFRLSDIAGWERILRLCMLSLLTWRISRYEIRPFSVGRAQRPKAWKPIGQRRLWAENLRLWAESRLRRDSGRICYADDGICRHKMVPSTGDYAGFSVCVWLLWYTVYSRNIQPLQHRK